MTSSKKATTVDTIISQLEALTAGHHIKERIETPVEIVLEEFASFSEGPVDKEQFHTILTQFIQRLAWVSGSPPQRIDEEEALATGLSYIRHYYRNNHTDGYEAARLDAGMPHKAGMVVVLSQLAEIVKNDRTRVFVQYAFNRFIDPTDHLLKEAIASRLIEKINRVVGESNISIEPYRMTEHLEELFQRYLECF